MLRLLNEFPRRAWLQGKVTIEVVAWDDPVGGTPLDATQTPQISVAEHHPLPSSCDLTIVILWGRLGTRLPSHVQKPDGKPYLSGTEWELEDARSAGKPVWIYRRKRFAPALDEIDYEDKVKQYNALKLFLGTLCDTDGSILGGLNQYETTTDLLTMLEHHLDAQLRRTFDLAARESSDVDERFRIFLADAADDLRGWRGRLKSQLSTLATVKLLEDLPPPYFDKKEDHAVAAREATSHADLCVHLLGQSPGAIVGTDPRAVDTYPMEQLRAALDHGHSQLILHPDGFRAEFILDAAYRKLITEAHERQDGRVRLEIVYTTSVETQELILDKRRSILSDRERISERKSKSAGIISERAAFIDVHELDKDYAKQLVEFLGGRVKTLPEEAGGARAPRQDLFEETVSRAQYLIVVFGEVATQWGLARLEEAVKIALEREQRLKCGIYLRPGAPALGAAFKAPRYSTVIDNSSGFNQAPIEQFIGVGDGT